MNARSFKAVYNIDDGGGNLIVILLMLLFVIYVYLLPCLFPSFLSREIITKLLFKLVTYNKAILLIVLYIYIIIMVPDDSITTVHDDVAISIVYWV